MNIFNAETINLFSGVFGNHFDSFSSGRQITIFKEPVKNIINTNDNIYYGYEQGSQQLNYTTTPVSGVYPAIIQYNKNQKTELIDNLNIRYLKGDVTIKVKEDAAAFIDNGKTENILVDNQYFNLISDRASQNYLGLKYFYYGLEKTS